VVHEDGLGDVKGGGAEVAVQFHKIQISKINFQGRRGKQVAKMGGVW
jgi:hypothetical protein